MYLVVSCAGPTVIKPASERNCFPPLERESGEGPLLSEILCVYDMEFLPLFPACPLTLWESFPGCPVGYVHPLPNSATSNPSLHTCESSPALIKFKVTWAIPPYHRQKKLSHFFWSLFTNYNQHRFKITGRRDLRPQKPIKKGVFLNKRHSTDIHYINTRCQSPSGDRDDPDLALGALAVWWMRLTSKITSLFPNSAFQVKGRPP